MFTNEQELQLSKWGCPDNFGRYPGQSESDTKQYLLHRQPHDVLAWLSRLQGYTAWLAANVVVKGYPPQPWSAYWRTITVHGPDPYAATFALAQAVMEDDDDSHLQQDDGPDGLGGDW